MNPHKTVFQEPVLRLGSVCSGVGGMDMGLEAAGFALAWLCEKDTSCRTVLTHHWPAVPIYDDLEALSHRDDIPSVDLLAGGTPCQDLSVAGRRAGLDGARSGLFFAFCRLADRLAPPWILWENVDGALSSSDGEDFAICLEGFTGFRPAVPEDGWKSAGVCVGPLRWCVWRVLDAQWFGVAQRRARVFVVAGTGAIPRPEILLEPESVSGDSAPRRTAGEGTTSDAGDSVEITGVRSVARPLRAQAQASHREDSDTYVPMLANAITAREAKGVNPAKGVSTVVAHTLTGRSAADEEDGTGRGVPIVAVDLQQVTSKANRVKPSPEAPPLNTAGNVVAFALRGREGGAMPEVAEDGNVSALRGASGGSSRDMVLAYDDRNQAADENVHHTLRGEGIGSRVSDAVLAPTVTSAVVSNGDSHSGFRDEHGLVAAPITANYGKQLDNSDRNGGPPNLINAVVPRRLTPRECERLMGWSDDHTRYGRLPSGKVVELKDSPRYRMIGNGVVRNVAEWIGLRIMGCVVGESEGVTRG